jgi:peroxiredoxin
MAAVLRADVSLRSSRPAAPDFDLESHTGERVRLSAYHGRENVAVFFMRAHTCLTCILHAVQLKQAQAALEALGTRLIIVVPGTIDQARKIGKLLRATFPVLADPDRSAVRRFGLGRWLYVMQRSGTALVDRGGTLVYARRSTDPRGALDLAELVAAVRKLQAE